MNYTISFDDKLISKGSAKCPKCNEGIIRSVFSDPEIVLDYKCDKCGYRIHFERAVVVE